jgi:hypothetical protein
MIDDRKAHARIYQQFTAGSFLLSLRFPDGTTRQFSLERVGRTGTFYGIVP